MRTFNHVTSYINLRDTQETDWCTMSPDDALTTNTPGV